MPDNWTLRRWIRESQKYMSHRSKLAIAFLAIFKWPAFNRQQKLDMKDLGG